MAEAAKELHVDVRTARRMASAGALGAVSYAGRAKLVRRFEVDAHRAKGSR